MLLRLWTHSTTLTYGQGQTRAERVQSSRSLFESVYTSGARDDASINHAAAGSMHHQDRHCRRQRRTDGAGDDGEELEELEELEEDEIDDGLTSVAGERSSAIQGSDGTTLSNIEGPAGDGIGDDGQELKDNDAARTSCISNDGLGDDEADLEDDELEDDEDLGGKTI